MNTASTHASPFSSSLRRSASIAGWAVVAFLVASVAAPTADAQVPTRLDFQSETIDVGDAVDLTFSIDPSLVGQSVNLLTGSNLGPSQMGAYLMPLGGTIRRRAQFGATSPETMIEFTLPGGYSGKSFLLAFVTAVDDVVTSVSNVVSVQFTGSIVTFKHVPVPPGYGWVAGDSGSTQNLQSVAFADENRGFAGGPNSTLWATEDGGRTWAPQVIDTAVKAGIQDVEFADADHGFAIGSFFSGIVWTTIDGGRNWTRRGVNMLPLAVDFVDSRTGWLVGVASPFGGGSPIAKTTDGGVSWVAQARDLREELRAVKFVDRQNGVAAGRDGVVLMTSDGGETWVRKTLPAGYRDAYLMAADAMAGGDTVTVAGYDSVVLRTTDRGETWQPQRIPSDRSIFSVAFTSPLRGWLVGDRGSILWTFDGGDTWLPFDPNGSSVNETFNHIHAFDRDSLWAVGNAGEVRSFTIIENE